MVLLHPLTTIATYLLYFFFSDPDSHLCTSTERGVTCPTSSQSVCALIKARDPTSRINSYYEQTRSDSCTACGDPKVVGYIPGECGDIGTQICTTKPQIAMCTRLYEPVCTFTENILQGKRQIGTQTGQNSCYGCGVTGSKFFAQGACDKISSQICEKSQRGKINCPKLVVPVCAYHKGHECKEDLCQMTMNNECEACSDIQTIFYTAGACTDA